MTCGEGAAGSGVALFLPAACQTVAAHDAVGVADDLADILVAHAAVNAARLTVVGDAHIEECLPRVFADRVGVLCDEMALGLRRLGCRINIDAAPAAGVEVVVIVGGGGVFHLGLELCAEVLVLQLVGHGMETVCEVPRRHTGVQGRHVAGVRLSAQMTGMPSSRALCMRARVCFCLPQLGLPSILWWEMSTRTPA